MPRLDADGALHRLEVPEAPELEVLLQVDEFLAGLVRLPVGVRVLVDLGEHRHQLGVVAVRLRHVALQQGLDRHVVAGAGQIAQELVVDARRLERGRQQLLRRRVVVEDRQHPAVLVAEHELDRPVLVRLEARRRAEEAAELGVLRRGQRGQHRPLLGEAALDVLDPGQALERRAAGRRRRAGAARRAARAGSA